MNKSLALSLSLLTSEIVAQESPSVNQIEYKQQNLQSEILNLLKTLELEEKIESNSDDDISQNDFLTILATEEPKEVSIHISKNGTTASITIIRESGEEIVQTLSLKYTEVIQAYLLQKGINIKSLQEKDSNILGTITLSAISLLVMVATFLMIKQSLPTKKTKKVEKTKVNVTLDDVGGHENAKKDIKEIIDLMEEKRNIILNNGDLDNFPQIPKGIIFFGPTGTGKTLLARAVAGETNSNFYSVNGSDLTGRYVGTGAEKIRKIFKTAKENAPAILFIDEIDAVGARRSTTDENDNGVGRDMNATVNQLLTEMDGFEKTDDLLVIFGTNKLENLDEALTRPGRIDRKINITLPNLEQRMDIFKVATKKQNLDNDVDFEFLAARLPQSSGADISNVVNEATLTIHKENRTTITHEDLDDAIDRHLMGIDSGLKMSEKEAHRVAIHEAGHAVAALKANENTRVTRISIVPKGQALGVTVTPPIEEKLLYTKEDMLSQIKILLGGRLAELIILEDEGNGASDDLVKATNLATQMVTDFDWGTKEKDQLNVRSYKDDNSFSQDKHNQLESMIDELLQSCGEETLVLLKEHKPLLEDLTKSLMKNKTIGHEEIMNLVEKHQETQAT